MKPLSCLIIGCGRFGSQAAEKLLRRNCRPKVTVVDKSRKAIQRITSLPVEAVVGEGISYLHQALFEGKEIDFVIPAIPSHVAFEFILAQLRPWGAVRAGLPPLQGLPNVKIGRTGDLYSSLANFLCPEDCSEPSQYCTVTGKRRPKPLYKTLGDLKGPFESKVIRSEQLGPGAGGFRANVLLRLVEDIKKREKPNRLVLISTSCRCHGVTSALSP